MFKLKYILVIFYFLFAVNLLANDKHNILISCNHDLPMFSVSGVEIKDEPKLPAFNLYVNLDTKLFSLVPQEKALVKGTILTMNKDLIVLEMNGSKKFVYAYFFTNKNIVVLKGETNENISLESQKDFFSGQCDYKLN